MKKYIVKYRGIEWSYDNKEKAAKKAADLNTEVTEKPCGDITPHIIQAALQTIGKSRVKL